MNPTDLTTEMVRQWIQVMRARGLAPATVKSQVKLIKAILDIGVSEALLDTNAAKTLKLSGGSSTGYKPFTSKQVHQIFQATAEANIDYQYWLPRIGLYTGARIEELAQLTSEDVCEVEGIKCIWMKHEPDAEYPKQLKGKLRNERQVPIHPWLLEIGFYDFAKKPGQGRIFKGNGTVTKNTIGPSASRWFRLLTTRLGIYKKHELVFHSFRGTFKDMCRRGGIRGELHDAITGHSGGLVGETSYGETLRFMPKVTSEAIYSLPYPDKLSG